MAIDTLAKRASLIGLALPIGFLVPIPDTNLDQGDRQHLAHLYAGTLAGTATFPQVTEYGGGLVELCFGGSYRDWIAERGTALHHWYLSDILTTIAKDEISGFGDVIYFAGGEGTRTGIPVNSRGLLPEYGLSTYFDGVDDSVTLPSVSSLSTSDFTIACLVRPGGAGSGTNRCLVHTGASGAYLGLNTSDRAVFGLNGGTQATAAFTVQADEIYLLVGTRTGGNARIYVCPANGDPIVSGGPTAIGAPVHGVGEIGANAGATRYLGDLQGVALLNEALALADIEELQATAIWTDVSDDVEISAPVTTNRGIHDDSPIARLAATSTCTFVLDNGETNSAGLKGYYSGPDHADNRSGFDNGIPVRVSVPDTSSPTQYRVQFIGTIHSLKPQAGIYRERRTLVTCTDWLDEAARAPVTGLAVQANLRPENLIAVLMNAMRHKPHQVNFQTGTDTYVRALHDTRDEHALVIHELKKVVDSEYGWFYMRGDGTATFETRDSRDALALADHTMTDVLDIDQERARDQTKNLAHVTIHPGRVDLAPTVLYSLQTEAGSPDANQPLKIGVASEVSIFLPFRSELASSVLGEPVRIGAIDIVYPIAVTDYEINSLEDGSGTDLTTNPSLTFVFRLGGNGVYLDITNEYGADVYFTHLQIRGRGVYDYQPIVTSKQDDDLIRKHGAQLVTLDMPYQTSIDVAEDVAGDILAATATPATRIRSLTFLHNESTDMHAAGAEGEIGQIGSVSELMSGVNHEYYINGIRHEIGEEVFSLGESMSLIRTTWFLAPRLVTEAEEPAEPVDSTIAFERAYWGLYNGGTSNTWTMGPTTSGDNRLILIGVVTNGASDNLTSITYDGVSILANLVRKASPVIDGIQRQMYVFYLINPPLGTKTVVVTCSAVQGILGGYWTCSGARQSSQPDNSAIVTGLPSTSFTSTITPITDNSWVVCFNVGRDGSPPWVGAGTVRRFHDHGFGLWSFNDNNGPVSPPALTSQTTTRNNNNNPTWHVIMSIAPSG